MSSQKKFIFTSVSCVLMIQTEGKRLNNVMFMSEDVLKSFKGNKKVNPVKSDIIVRKCFCFF